MSIEFSTDRRLDDYTDKLITASMSQSKTVLLTGGRAPCTLELARALDRAGHRVLVAESVLHHLCGASLAVAASFLVPAPHAQPDLYIEEIKKIVLSEQVDVLIPTCEEIFYIAKGLERLSCHCKVWASSLSQLSQLHHKWSFVHIAERLTLNVPQSTLIQSQEELLAYASEHSFADGFILKPAYSRFGSQVILLPDGLHAAPYDKQLKEMLAAVSPKQPWVAQRRIVGRQLCTYSVAHEGELVAHSTYPCTYTVGKGTAIYFEAIEHHASLEWVRKLVKELSFTGQISFDFIEEESGELFAIECNPRTTSGLHLLAVDAELIQAFIEPEVLKEAGKFIRPNPATKKMITAAMLTAGLASIRSFRQFRGWLQAITSADDVVISRHDIKPSLQQLRVAFQLWKTSRARSISLQQATTIDIEWNGEP